MYSEITDVANIISRKLGSIYHNPCFCGSGKNHIKCCQKKIGADLFKLSQNDLDKIVKYKDSLPNKQIELLPAGLFEPLLNSIINKLPCLIPKCSDAPINSHLYPANKLIKVFGAHCYEKSYENKWIKKGCQNQAGTKRVFCANCDNNYFVSIDNLNFINFTEKELFLLTFKSLAFTLRKIQIMLGVDTQVELLRPFLMTQKINPYVNKKTEYQINLNKLQNQYIGYCITYKIYKSAYKAYLREDWSFFNYHSKSIKYTKGIFWSSYMNPLFDINGNKINTGGEVISMGCNIISDGKNLHTLIATPRGKCSQLYTPFIQQIFNSTRDNFLLNLNNYLLAKSVDDPLLLLKQHKEKDLDSKNYLI